LYRRTKIDGNIVSLVLSTPKTLSKTPFGPRCYSTGEMHAQCSSGYPRGLHGQSGGSELWCQFHMADAGLPEAGVQTAQPCDLSMGQLLLRWGEVIKVPIFTFLKHQLSQFGVWDIQFLVCS